MAMPTTDELHARHVAQVQKLQAQIKLLECSPQLVEKLLEVIDSTWLREVKHARLRAERAEVLRHIPDEED